MIYLCTDHGIIGEDQVTVMLTNDGDCNNQCWCGRPVREYIPPLEHEFLCNECGYRCWDPDINVDNGRITRRCPKCGQKE